MGGRAVSGLGYHLTGGTMSSRSVFQNILKFLKIFLKRVGKMIHSDRRHRPRYVNPVMLTRQYMNRVNTPPHTKRARWINAWLGVSGKTG